MTTSWLLMVLEILVSPLHLPKLILPVDPPSQVDGICDCLLDISSCLSNEHLKLSMTKSEFLTFSPKSTPPEYFRLG